MRRVELRESWARSINVFTCASRRWIERIVKTRSRRRRGGLSRDRSTTFFGFRSTLPRDHAVVKTRETRDRMCAERHAREGFAVKEPSERENTHDAGRLPRLERERGRRCPPTRALSEELRGCFGKKTAYWHTHLLREKIVAVHHRSPTPAQTSGCRASTLEERDGLQPFRLPRRVSANPRTPRGGGS